MGTSWRSELWYILCRVSWFLFSKRGRPEILKFLPRTFWVTRPFLFEWESGLHCEEPEFSHSNLIHARLVWQALSESPNQICNPYPSRFSSSSASRLEFHVSDDAFSVHPCMYSWGEKSPLLLFLFGFFLLPPQIELSPDIVSSAPPFCSLQHLITMHNAARNWKSVTYLIQKHF